MTKSIISPYEVKISRTNHRIPVINEVHIHSTYNPINEAKMFVSTNEKIIKSKNNILILGLGFGYHIQELLESMIHFHQDNFSVFVIEPVKRLLEDCLEYGTLDLQRVTVFTENNPDLLYTDRRMVDFLMKRPGIIAHPPSFNLNSGHYKSILSYKAPKAVKDLLHVIENVELAEYLAEFNPPSDIFSIVENEISSKAKLENEFDFLLMSLFHMNKKMGPHNTQTGDKQ